MVWGVGGLGFGFWAVIWVHGFSQIFSACGPMYKGLSRAPKVATREAWKEPFLRNSYDKASSIWGWI